MPKDLYQKVKLYLWDLKKLIGVHQQPSKLLNQILQWQEGENLKLKIKYCLINFIKKDGTYIEKSKFRIDTLEEVRGISALGNMDKTNKVNFFKSMKNPTP